VGLVGKTDLVMAQHANADTEVDQRGATSGQHVHEAEAIVRDVMTPMVVWLPPTASVAEATRVMVTSSLHAVPVVSDGRVVGMLSSTDVMSWVAGIEQVGARSCG
jgi:CBS domain-containing protein